MKMVESSELDKELRHMKASHLLNLCSILDVNESWKCLMSIITDENNNNRLKYSTEHMRMIENAGEKQRRSCSEILLEEWGTSGKVRPRYSSLRKFLIEAQLYRAAEHVHLKLLESEEPLERPCTGPASKRKIPNLSDNSLSNFSDDSKGDLTLINESSTLPPFTSNASITEPVNPLLDDTVPVGDYPDRFKYSDLLKWTENFSQRLGQGAFGSVYLCLIPLTKAKVAVKRLQNNNLNIPVHQLPTQFHNEISALTKFKHENVLTLLGYCCDGPDLCLVYDYMPNGSLEDKIKDESSEFEWITRLNISVGAAKGIHYLHTFSDEPHLHRDIKSANILLDENLIPKLGDFGLARRAPMETVATTTIVGTTAYMSPEALRGEISIKMDVFSFGVVLLEIVTGLLAWDETRESRSLVSYVDDFDDAACLIDCRPENPEDDIAMNLFKVSQECLLVNKRHRPNMTRVLEMLLNISSH